MKLSTKNIEKQIKEFYEYLVAQYDNRAIVMTVILVAVFLFGITRFIMPGISDVSQRLNLAMEKKKMVAEIQQKLADEEVKIREGFSKRKKIPVVIYETPYKNFELEIASSEIISRIIDIINSHGNNRITALDFEKKELKDNNGMASKQHSVLTLKIEMESSYDGIQKILNDIYLMEYLVQINTVTLVSLEEYNYKKVKVYMELDLPVKTG